jgi:hypothetical protein
MGNQAKKRRAAQCFYDPMPNKGVWEKPSMEALDGVIAVRIPPCSTA